MFTKDHKNLNTSRGVSLRLAPTRPNFNSLLMRSKATQIETGTAEQYLKKRVYLTLNPSKKMQQGAIVKAKFIKKYQKRTKL